MSGITACSNGRFDENYAHDFTGFAPDGGGQPLMFCERCGEVRRLALPIEEGTADERLPYTERDPDTGEWPVMPRPPARED